MELTPLLTKMILMTLLLATVSASKLNVPRLRLSYKGKVVVKFETNPIESTIIDRCSSYLIQT